MKEIVILPAANCRRSQKVLTYLEQKAMPKSRARKAWAAIQEN